MHNGPQIQDDYGTDASSMEDIGRKIGRRECPCGSLEGTVGQYRRHLVFCDSPKSKIISKFLDDKKYIVICVCEEKMSLHTNKYHVQKCESFKKFVLELNLYIKCKLCDYEARRLEAHVKKEHKLSPKEYKEKYGQIATDKSIRRSIEANTKNSRTYFLNETVEQKNKRISASKKSGKTLSAKIMANPKERARRSKLLGELNKTKKFRKKASDTAKITSARPDVQKNRSAQLKRWRDKNPEWFEEIRDVFVGSAKTKTKPEISFESFVQENHSHLGLKYSQFIRDDRFHNKTKTKQIDFANSDFSVMIEIDGPLHFDKDFFDVKKIRQNDIELNNYAKEKKSLFIRISYDQWNQRTGKISQECFDEVSNILDSLEPGIYFIGNAYKMNVGENDG